MIHVDVMDGRFVPNITLGPGGGRGAAAGRRALPLDAHLMIEDAERYLDAFVDAGATSISVHVEALPHLQRAIAHLRERGVSPGVALNPSTPIAPLEEILPELDYVLVMSVNPGFSYQKLLPRRSTSCGGCGSAIRARGLSVRCRWTAASTPATSAPSWRRAPRSWWWAPPRSAAATRSGARPDRGRPWPGRPRVRCCSEGRRHRRRRVHRLAPRREPARGRPRGAGRRLLHRLLPARRSRRRTWRRSARTRASAWSRSGSRTPTSRRCSTAPSTSSTSRPRPACARRGAATSPTTPSTTCSPPSACSRPRSRPGRPTDRLRLVVLGLRRRARAPAARGRAVPAGLALRRHQARRGAPRACSTTATTACRR